MQINTNKKNREVVVNHNPKTGFSNANYLVLRYDILQSTTLFSTISQYIVD